MSQKMHTKNSSSLSTWRWCHQPLHAFVTFAPRTVSELKGFLFSSTRQSQSVNHPIVSGALWVRWKGSHAILINCNWLRIWKGTFVKELARTVGAGKCTRSTSAKLYKEGGDWIAKVGDNLVSSLATCYRMNYAWDGRDNMEVCSSLVPCKAYWFVNLHAAPVGWHTIILQRFVHVCP